MPGTVDGVGFTVMVNWAGVPVQPAGLTKLPRENGFEPTGTVDITLFVAASITETSPELEFATYTKRPSPLTETPAGDWPTGTVAITASVLVLITETVPLTKKFATYNRLPSGLT